MAKKKFNLKGRIINLLRDLSKKHPQRKEVEDRTKVAPATHECQKCGLWLYKGTSNKNYENLKKEFPNKRIEKGRLEVDHNDPVISLEKGWEFSYDGYIERLFCGSEKLTGLCRGCHQKKSNIEKQIKKYKKDTKELKDSLKLYEQFKSEYLDE